MRIFDLSPRLATVAGLVPQGARFADVGTDHAYLPVWLLLQGVIDYAIASDVQEGPFNRAKQTAQRYGVSERLSVRLCNGLSGFSATDADTIAIAGMGGESIIEVLANAPWEMGKHRFILQPMTAQMELRTWLNCNQFRIEQELLTCEGKTLYVIFLVTAGQDKSLFPAERWAGRQQEGQRAPFRGMYLERLLCRVNRAMDGLQYSTKREDAGRWEDLAVVKDGLEQMKEEWEAWQR